MNAIHVIHSGDLDPVDNMALDEGFLASDIPAVLRLYGWHPTGLSIGYFQPFEAYTEVPGKHQIVRRTTGGGAIYHAQEITFALVCDAALLPRNLNANYRLVHDAIGRALERCGITARRCGSGTTSPRPDERWCFDRPTCHDLITDRGKIVGSAQRRTRSARPRVLHHGTIVLSAPAPTPHCGAVDEFVDPDAIRSDLERDMAQQICRALGLEVVTQPPPIAFDIAAHRATVRARLRRR